MVMPVVEQKSIQEEIVDASALYKITSVFSDFIKEINRQANEDKISKIATKVTIKAVKRNKSLWKAKLKNFGIDIKGKSSFKGEADYVKSRIRTNTKLIANLRDEYIERLSIDLSNAYEQGRPAKQLAKDIQQSFGISSRRAKLIARNETKNTNCQLNIKQAIELGFDYGTWITSIDGRERPEHKAHNNKKFKIGVGLDDGKGGKEQPGDAINCRCTFYIDI